MILLVLLLIHYIWAKDVPQSNTKYVINHISTCPAEGYYMKRYLPANSLGPGDCYLCFCQDNNTSVCWLRQNRRCDEESYHHRNVGKRGSRMRRSPISLGELFFQDAAKEVFNKQSPEVCKPFESSFSDGCPPEDWCIGCTVCDCNANGRWDCHVLSFCDDNKGKKQMKKRKTKSKVIISNPKNIPKRTNKKISKKVDTNKLSTSKVVKTAPALTTASPRHKNAIQKRNNSPKPQIFKKDVQTKKSLNLAQKKPKTTNSSTTDQFTQEVVKKVVTAMQNLLRKQVTATVPEIIKIIQKKSMEMNNMNKKNQMDKIKNAMKHKVTTINKKKNNRPAATYTFPTKSNKAMSLPWPYKTTKTYNISFTANKLTGTNKSGTSNAETRSLPYKKANTKLSEFYRFKRNAIIDIETTEVENFTPTAPIQNREPTENKYVTTIDGYYNNSAASTTPIFYNTENINSFTTHSIDDIENIPQPLNNSDIVSRLAATESLFNNTDVRTQIPNGIKRVHGLLDKIANSNDLKYMDWFQMKTYKEKEKEFRTQLSNSSHFLNISNNFDNYSNVVDFVTESKVKVHRYNVERNKVPKRFNITRVISTTACHPKHENKYSVNSFSKRISQKIDGLQSVLRKIFTGFWINNTTTDKSKGKFNLVKYLNKFFRKLFYRNKTNDAYMMNNKHTIETLCASFGPCVKNKRNKLALQQKFKELENEINLMTKSINIIKGLLKLLDFPFIEKPTNSFVIDEYNFSDDIQKLSIILKNQYSDTLSETQLTQIDYVKNNTQVLIQSVARFVSILNDLIPILRLKNNKINEQSKSDSIQGNIKNPTNQEHLKSFKKLLLKYNIVQNTFMKKMYEMLTKFDLKNSSDGTKSSESGSNTNETCNAVDCLSKKIIQNLRKFKSIAEILSSGGRKKRQLINDNTMEYLLTIMEYLMKKKQPLDVAPAVDGIDVLIEAIQNAPDIKPLLNQVTYVPSQKAAVIFGMKSSNDTLDDNYSDSIFISKENNFTSNADVSKSLHDDQLVDEETYINPSKYDKKIENEEEIFSFSETNNSTKEKKHTKFTKSKYVNDITDRELLDVEHSNVNSEDAPGEVSGKRKFKLFVADYVDDTDIEENFTTSTNAPELFTEHSSQTMTLPVTDDFILSKMKMRQFNINNGFMTNGSDETTKTTLQWINIDDEEEDKLGLVDSLKETTIEPITEASTQPVTFKIPIKKSLEDISNFSKEIRDEDKKKLSKLNIDKVMFKKQMDLMNALDYGTEGLIVEDPDSKSIRYSNDVYDML